MMVWNQIEVLGVKIPNKIAKSYCPNLCPIFSFWRWNFQDPNFTVLTDFYTRNQLVSQLYMPNDTIGVLEVWLKSEDAHSRKLNKRKSCILKILSHFQIWNFLNTNLTDWMNFLSRNRLFSWLMMVWNQIEVLGVKIPNKIAKSYCPNLCPIFSFWRWNFQDRNFTVLTDFFTRNQL